MTSDIREFYTQDYRHFDNLIWQIPVWATAVFSLSMSAAVLVIANASSIEQKVPIDALRSLSVFLFAIFIALLLFTNVFLRFRLHQRSVHRPHQPEVPSLWFMLPGQTSLLFLLFVEASIDLCLALMTAGVSLCVSRSIALIYFIVGFLYVEMAVRTLPAALNRIGSNLAKTDAS